MTDIFVHHQNSSQPQTNNETNTKLLLSMFQRGDVQAKNLESAFKYFDQTFRLFFFLILILSF